jgi:hypothetical protein
VPVATADAQTGPVTMEWFHEVYPSMPTTAPTPPGRISSGIIWDAYDAALGRYDGYTLYPPIDPSAPVGADQYLWSQNFHYYGGGRNQLLPLTSTNYQEGDIFWDPTRLGYDSSAGVGVRLFEGIDKNAVDVSIMEAVSSPKVTHLRYALEKKR